MKRKSTKKKGSVKSSVKGPKSERTMSELSLNSTASAHIDPETQYRDIKLAEMMKYYTPRWMAVVGFLASIMAAFNLPMFGFVLSRYVSVLALPIATEAEMDYFVEQRNVWTLAFAALVIGIGVSTFGQMLCFGWGGDNLTQQLRIKLFE